MSEAQAQAETHHNTGPDEDTAARIQAEYERTLNNYPLFRYWIGDALTDHESPYFEQLQMHVQQLDAIQDRLTYQKLGPLDLMATTRELFEQQALLGMFIHNTVSDYLHKAAAGRIA